MESELDLLLGTAIDSLLKLEILLHLHVRAGEVVSAREVAAHLRRQPKEVAPALAGLAGAELIARFPLGTGRHVLFGSSEDRRVVDLMALLYERYHRDPVSRAGLVREVMGPPEAGPAETRSSCRRSSPLP